MTPFATLILLKDTLAAVEGVASCRIGLEANITPADYPLIRIVPTRLIPSTLADDDDLYLRQMEVLIYFGAALLEAADGLEAVYAELLTLEAAINQALVTAAQAVNDSVAYFQLAYVETITDEDRLPHYKLFASRWRIEG